MDNHLKTSTIRARRRHRTGLARAGTEIQDGKDNDDEEHGAEEDNGDVGADGKNDSRGHQCRSAPSFYSNYLIN